LVKQKEEEKEKNCQTAGQRKACGQKHRSALIF
jgi:hypothetical protein